MTTYVPCLLEEHFFVQANYPNDTEVVFGSTELEEAVEFFNEFDMSDPYLDSIDLYSHVYINKKPVEQIHYDVRYAFMEAE